MLKLLLCYNNLSYFFQVILVFCWVYVRKYQSRQESEVISTITSIFALAIALITSALLPVDIFLVSYVKNQNGTFKVFIHLPLSIIFITNPVLLAFLFCFGKKYLNCFKHQRTNCNKTDLIMHHIECLYFDNQIAASFF